MAEIKIVVTEPLKCPKCGCNEVENPEAPVHKWIFNIRAYRVQTDSGKWWSQCLKCAGDRKDKGWF